MWNEEKGLIKKEQKKAFFFTSPTRESPRHSAKMEESVVVSTGWTLGLLRPMRNGACPWWGLGTTWLAQSSSYSSWVKAACWQLSSFSVSFGHGQRGRKEKRGGGRSRTNLSLPIHTIQVIHPRTFEIYYITTKTSKRTLVFRDKESG